MMQGNGIKNLFPFFCVNIELKVRSYVNRPIFIIRGIFTAVLVKSKTEVYELAS